MVVMALAAAEGWQIARTLDDMCYCSQGAGGIVLSSDFAALCGHFAAPSAVDAAATDAALETLGVVIEGAASLAILVDGTVRAACSRAAARAPVSGARADAPPVAAASKLAQPLADTPLAFGTNIANVGAGGFPY